MIRLLLWLLGGLLLGGIVHLATVLLLPKLATQDAYARVAAIAPVNTVTPLPPPSPDDALLPFMDPAFAVAVCRFDLSRGPLKFSVPISPAYTSVSFYTRTDVPFYAINDRAAGRRVIELDLMTQAQRDRTAAERGDHGRRPPDRVVADDDRPDRDPGAGARARPDDGRARRADRRAVPAAVSGSQKWPNVIAFKTWMPATSAGTTKSNLRECRCQAREERRRRRRRCVLDSSISE